MGASTALEKVLMCVRSSNCFSFRLTCTVRHLYYIYIYILYLYNKTFGGQNILSFKV